jgi:hypothetical protein
MEKKQNSRDAPGAGVSSPLTGHVELSIHGHACELETELLWPEIRSQYL